MRNVMLPKDRPDSIYLNDINENEPIFAKYNNRICGMVVNEPEGWILKIGGTYSINGHFDTREQCIRSLINSNYSFIVND